MTAIETTIPEEVKIAEVEPDELVIRPIRGWIGVDWAEILRFRELLFFLVWRDLKVRYKQTVLGVAWAVLQPLFNMLVFTMINRLAKIGSEGVNPYIYIYAALLPWTFFSTGVNLGGLSLINQAHLLTKVYFPRLFVPSAAILAGLVDMAISFGMFAILLICFKTPVSWQIVFLPVLIGWTMMATLGLGYLLSSLTVSYRDFRYIIPFMLQGMMLLSPIMYPVSFFDKKYQWIAALNPMSGIIDAFRSCLLGTAWNFQTVGISAGMTLVLFVFGLYYFRRTERKFADIA